MRKCLKRIISFTPFSCLVSKDRHKIIITIIIIIGNKIGDDGATEIARSLEKNNVIHTIDLTGK